jgi:hypothetical protein
MQSPYLQNSLYPTSGNLDLLTAITYVKLFGIHRDSKHKSGRALTHAQTRRAVARKQARREMQAKSRRYNRYH